MTLEATRAQFDELLDKFERSLARGNKLNRELTQATRDTQKISAELLALMKSLREHVSEPGVLGAIADMAARMQAALDRNPSLPIQ